MKSIQVIGSIVLAICAFVGGYYVISGIVVGLITTGGFLILLYKSPQWIQRLVWKYSLLVDLAFTALAYPFFPKGLIGFIGAGASCILISIAISLHQALAGGDAGSHRITMLKEVARS